ncbi:MAG TPA: hypothetical protein VGR61_09835 [Candidatus Dormibacteraeota bacterium]|nr:hypothetical protein [Candidatus Dormibacteraeota bacterium]
MINRPAKISVRPAGLFAVLLMAACGGTVQEVPGPSPSPSNAPLQAVVATAVSDQCAPCTLVGKDRRLPLGIVDGNGVPVADVKVRVQVFSVPSGSAAPIPLGPVVDAPYHGELLQGKGVYVVHQTFDSAGIYKVVVQASKGTISAATEANFTVVATDPGIAVGSPAPPTNNQLASQVKDISTIDTGVPPDDMHYTTIAAALAAHHPVVVYFGSPGFCQTKTCAPEVDVVKALEARYRAMAVDFVHIETYKGGRPDANRTVSDEFNQWKLTSDPWVIVVDKQGKVAAKFDGPTTSDEIDPVVAQAAS